MIDKAAFLQQAQLGHQVIEDALKITGRRCGSCTLCCRLLGVDAPPTLSKPPNTKCPHCSPGRGCNIYEQRPAQCRVFFCLWLVNASLDDSFHPAKCHFVIYPVDNGSDGAAVMVEVDPHRPDSWFRQPYWDVITQMAIVMPASTVRVGNRWYRLFPREVARHPERIAVMSHDGQIGRTIPGRVGPGYFKTDDGDYQWLEVEPPPRYLDAWRFDTLPGLSQAEHSELIEEMKARGLI
jgi:hypothetical protein